MDVAHWVQQDLKLTVLRSCLQGTCFSILGPNKNLRTQLFSTCMSLVAGQENEKSPAKEEKGGGYSSPAGKGTESVLVLQDSPLLDDDGVSTPRGPRENQPPSRYALN